MLLYIIRKNKFFSSYLLYKRVFMGCLYSLRIFWTKIKKKKRIARKVIQQRKFN